MDEVQYHCDSCDECASNCACPNYKRDWHSADEPLPDNVIYVDFQAKKRVA
jgi:hypothetical protein